MVVINVENVLGQSQVSHLVSQEDAQVLFASFTPDEQACLDPVEWVGKTLLEVAGEFDEFAPETMLHFLVALWPEEFEVDY